MQSITELVKCFRRPDMQVLLKARAVAKNVKEVSCICRGELKELKINFNAT